MPAASPMLQRGTTFMPQKNSLLSPAWGSGRRVFNQNIALGQSRSRAFSSYADAQKGVS